MIKNIQDKLNLISKITLKRSWNASLNVAGYIISKITGKQFIKFSPIAISIEPTTSCNLRCPECPSGLRNFTRPTGMLELDMYKKIIDELYERLIYVTLYFQGEPYLNPNFIKLINYASQKNLYTSTSTNGHYLNSENAKKTVQSGLDKLIISIDGTSQETYEKYRVGGTLSKVLEGTRNIIYWKKNLKSNKPHVIFQFLVVKPNQNQINEIRKLASDIGVDEVSFKTAQIYNFEKGSPLIPTIPKYSRYTLNDDGNYEIKNKLLNHCWKMWHSCVITWDGAVLPCCFDKDGKYKMGDVKNNSFSNIWNNQKYAEFRKLISNSRREIDICKNCTEGTKVWG